jgi:hypothetical protein
LESEARPRQAYGEAVMSDISIVLLAIGLLILVGRLFKGSECDHAERVYYDAAGDELPTDQSDACFCKCLKCGQVSVIPSGFQSDAHFDHYLHEGEMGGSQAVKKINRGRTQAGLVRRH